MEELCGPERSAEGAEHERVAAEPHDEQRQQRNHDAEARLDRNATA
jgi:hypothetical protein